ncbi:PE-PPE domain-containing protein [Mycolicibacter longobardus]|uniref:PE-PPE domain-containing protein n=1 Tax=Mycolicibacter longobardus TaxID=1108812 RepID=A0A1X1Y725_9MYCO|nr:PE-PPE domain-containing protein [Mycolicibacter longobardus]MCV7383631.1 PE-PPE domain-containing protein [Mycolicibacter longobardus]ORW06856.1 PE-PPE domain-containing protein [Mycolicibacter longobardus]
MTDRRVHPLGATLLAALCTVFLALSSLLGPALASRLEKLVADITLLAGEGWIMTGTGHDDPTTAGIYMDLVRDFYLQPVTPWFAGQTEFPGYTFEGLTTPNQFCPIVCQPLPVPQLNFADSLAQGAANLDAAIRPQLEAGDSVTVFGFSQSAVVATLAMQSLLADAPGGEYDPLNLHFVLIGDPNSAIGGILSRLHFADGLDGGMQHIPFLNIPLGIGAGPTEFSASIYSTEYDGWSNFPQDPTNVVAVLNALMGILAVHNAYFNDNLANAVDLGSIGSNDFYMLPTAQLPILGPLYGLGDFGKLVGDALAPVLKVLIDWSYGNPGAPDAGISVGGVDPIGAAGPWAVTATGHLSEDTGVAGFLLRMDPLQMLAGLQYAGVQSLTNTINNLLDFAGQDPLSQSVVDSLLGGYNFTIELDQALLNGWQELATEWNVLDVLGPAAIFNGAPLISAQPLLDLVGLGFSLVNYLDA